jgi:hypothetical protein
MALPQAPQSPRTTLGNPLQKTMSKDDDNGNKNIIPALMPPPPPNQPQFFSTSVKPMEAKDELIDVIRGLRTEENPESEKERLRGELRKFDPSSVTHVVCVSYQATFIQRVAKSQAKLATKGGYSVVGAKTANGIYFSRQSVS